MPRLRFSLSAAVLASLAVGCATPNGKPSTVVPTVATEPPVEREEDRPVRVDPALVAAARTAAASSAVVAHESAMKRAVGWQTLPPELPWRQILDPDRAQRGSMSAGTVASGVLLNAAEFAFEGTHYSVIERHRKYKTRYATEELLDLIRFASTHVQTSDGGAPLRVGNMSKRGGGDIRWSNSHNSGRDADLAFYVLRKADGKSVASPDLVRFVEGGQADGRDDLVFDVPRNWRLVEGLLTHPNIGVQWLFISLPLKKMLLDHAKTIGADPEVIRRAEVVLHQPTDSSPHNDHFHLRITCPKDDRLDGCLDYGPKWDWVDWHEVDLLARAVRLAEAFEGKSVDDKLRALDFLDSIKSPYAADVATAWGLWDKAADVRERSMRVTESQHSWSGSALAQLFRYIESAPDDARHVARSYRVLRRSVDDAARDFALSRLLAQTSVGERVEAARALGHFMQVDLAVPLIEQLEAQPPAVRAEIATVLQRITNHAEGVEWAEASAADTARGLLRWKNWWKRHGHESREEWLAAGFAEHGIKPQGALQPSDVDALIELLPVAPAHIVYNANRTIRELTGRWAPLEQSDGAKLHKYWTKWWKKNRERVLSEGPLGDS